MPSTTFGPREKRVIRRLSHEHVVKDLECAYISHCICNAESKIQVSLPTRPRAVKNIFSGSGTLAGALDSHLSYKG